MASINHYNHDPVNRRFELFCIRYGLDARVLIQNGSAQRIKIHSDGGESKWNVDYVIWNQEMWSKWKTAHGLDWLTPVALKQHNGFDAWLEQEVASKAGSPCDSTCSRCARRPELYRSTLTLDRY